MKTVYIWGDNSKHIPMWRQWGWKIADTHQQADVIQFSGNVPIVPHNPWPDLYHFALKNEVPMCGVGVGGQYLNVMNGGHLFHNCDGHDIRGAHKAVIRDSGLVIDVNSYHTQIMIPDYEKGIVLMESAKMGTRKEFTAVRGGTYVYGNKPDADDIEAVYYEDTNSLCFQPHPELMDEDDMCVQAYKYFIRNYLGVAI